MKLSAKKAVIVTICYHDIFSYPMTLDEINSWLPFVRKKISNLPKELSFKEVNKIKYFFLKGRKFTVKKRLELNELSKLKWKKAKDAASFLAKFPTILMVGVSGSLAMNSASNNDDIDFYIVTRSGTLWISRFFVNIYFSLIGKRRKPKDLYFRDKYCFNMFVTQDYLELPIGQRNIYSAHEVLQFQPIWSRLNTYEKYLFANSWVKDYIYKKYMQNMKLSRHYEISNISPHAQRLVSFLRNLNNFFMKIQLIYMRNRRTIEKVALDYAQFHPVSYDKIIKAKLSNKLTNFNIAIDKVYSPFLK